MSYNVTSDITPQTCCCSTTTLEASTHLYLIIMKTFFFFYKTHVSLQIKCKPFFTKKQIWYFINPLFDVISKIIFQIWCHSSVTHIKALSIVLVNLKRIWDLDVQCFVELVTSINLMAADHVQKKISKACHCFYKWHCAFFWTII